MLARFTAATALSLAVLSGCGSEPVLDPAAAPSQDKEAQNVPMQLERVKADCMKQKGFKYIPFVMPAQKETQLEKRVAEGDYAATREFRAKYGFQVFAAHVYPHDLASGAFVPESRPENPNSWNYAALNETQLNASQEAEDACLDKAAQKVLGKKAPSRMEFLLQRVEASKQIKERELDGDPRLLELAASFGDCLKTKGYAVGSLKPTVLEKRGMDAFRMEQDKFGPGKNGNGPDLTADQARPYLAREIKAALDDLECGKEFYAVYAPRNREIGLRVSREFGRPVAE